MENGSASRLFPQFKDRWASAFAAAAHLRDELLAGVKGRLRVALQTTDPLSFSALCIAFARCGSDLYLFNPAWGRLEQQRARRLARPGAVIGDFTHGRFQLETNAAVLPLSSSSEAVPSLRLMIPTGGSSGAIRFAIHDWDSVASAIGGFQQRMGCGAIGSHCVLPLYHVSGFMQLARALLSGGCIVFGRVETFAERHPLMERIPLGDRFLSLVATQLERLLREEEARRLLRNYRAVFLGGGPARSDLLETCRSLRIPLAPTYGMTETAAQVATLLPEEFLQGENSQGRPLPHLRVDLMDESDLERLATPGEPGRIRVSGASLFRGYVGATDERTDGSWVTTDLGEFDSSGNLRVLGRADRVIISGGEKVNLREIELAVEETKLVRDAIAFAVDDVEWGQKLALAYVPNEPRATEAAIRAALEGRLSRFKLPKLWIRMEELPRNEAGKPLLEALRSAREI